jgi:hypothetical protein
MRKRIMSSFNLKFQFKSNENHIYKYEVFTSDFNDNGQIEKIGELIVQPNDGKFSFVKGEYGRMLILFP